LQQDGVDKLYAITKRFQAERDLWRLFTEYGKISGRPNSCKLPSSFSCVSVIIIVVNGKIGF